MYILMDKMDRKNKQPNLRPLLLQLKLKQKYRSLNKNNKMMIIEIIYSQYHIINNIWESLKQLKIFQT